MMNTIDTNHAKMIAGNATAPKLKDAEIRAMEKSYVQMFSALTYQNMLSKQPLGQAWYSALKQMESFVATKDKFNPAAAEMHKIFTQHKKHISKLAMTHKNKDRVINPTPQQRAQMQSRISADVNAGKDAMNKIITTYKPFADQARSAMEKLAAEKAKQKMPGTTPRPTVKTFQDAKKQINTVTMQQMQLHLLMLQRQRQRTA